MKWYYVICIILGILLLINFLIWFLIAPGSDKKVYNYDFLFKRPIVHRGLHDGNHQIIENSKSAFQLAIDKNYNIEMDINLTKDNKIVVFHDGNLKRICGIDKKVHDLTLEELQKLPLLTSDEYMMEFSEFLKFVNGQVGILIEYKGEGAAIDKELCEQSMKILKDYKGKYVIQSFQPSILKWFRKNYPVIPRGQLNLNYNREFKDVDSKDKLTKVAGFMFSNNLTNFIGRPNFMARKYDALDASYLVMHHFMKTLVWTINSESKYKKVVNQVDNVIFERLEFDKDGKYIQNTK